MKTQTTLVWKTWPQKPTLADLPIAVSTSDSDIHSYSSMIPTWLSERPLTPPAYWAPLRPPHDAEEEEEDPLKLYGYIAAVRDAVIASSNADSADHAKRIFNETFLEEIKV
jgi:hypothetical protein